MQELNRNWNSDFTYVVFDPRGTIFPGYETDEEGTTYESRLCISYGRNRTSRGKQFLAPPYCLGAVVLAMHNFLVRNGTEAFLVDSWWDAFPVQPTTDLSVIDTAARVVLSDIDDETYFRMMEQDDQIATRSNLECDLFQFTFSDEG